MKVKRLLVSLIGLAAMGIALIVHGYRNASVDAAASSVRPSSSIWARWNASELKSFTPGRSASTQNQPAAGIETEIVTVTPMGFDPGEITRPQGRFMLAIDNRSGLDEVDLYLERETVGRVNVALSRKGKLAWRETVDFPPGHYVLRAANDQSWRCTITITPR